MCASAPLSSSSLTERGHGCQITEMQQGSFTETTSFGKISLQMLHSTIFSGGFGDKCNSFSMSILHFLMGSLRKCMDIEKELHISPKPPEEIEKCNICSELLPNDVVSVKLPCCISVIWPLWPRSVRLLLDKAIFVEPTDKAWRLKSPLVFVFLIGP